MVTVYEKIGIEKGREVGILEAQEKSLLRRLTKRFGKVSAALTRKIGSITSFKQFDLLFDQAIDVGTLAEFELP